MLAMMLAILVQSTALTPVLVGVGVWLPCHDCGGTTSFDRIGNGSVTSIVENEDDNGDNGVVDCS